MAVSVVEVLVHVPEKLAAALVVGIRERAPPHQVVHAEVLQLVRLGHHAYNELSQRVVMHQHGEQKSHKMGVSVQFLHIAVVSSSGTYLLDFLAVYKI